MQLLPVCALAVYEHFGTVVLVCDLGRQLFFFCSVSSLPTATSRFDVPADGVQLSAARSPVRRLDGIFSVSFAFVLPEHVGSGERKSAQWASSPTFLHAYIPIAAVLEWR